MVGVIVLLYIFFYIHHMIMMTNDIPKRTNEDRKNKINKKVYFFK